MLAPVPAGELVYTAVTVMLEPLETGEMLVMLPTGGRRAAAEDPQESEKDRQG